MILEHNPFTLIYRRIIIVGVAMGVVTKRDAEITLCDGISMSSLLTLCQLY